MSVLVFLVMNGLLVDAMRQLVRHREDVVTPAWLRVLTQTSLGLYLGWSSIAVCVNVAAALTAGGWSPDEYGWQAGVLVVAAIVGLGLTVFLRANPGYVAAVLWALVAVTVGAADRGAVSLSTVAAVAGAVVLVIALVVSRGRDVHVV